MTELTREQITEWLLVAEAEAPGPWTSTIAALCRTLLAAWGYEAEARAAREWLAFNGYPLIPPTGVICETARRYAAARAACERAERGE